MTIPSDAEFLARNDVVIADFEAHGGRSTEVPFPILLLTTTGARTGQPRRSPLGYWVSDGAVYVVASKAGAPAHPAWYRNLVANPAVTVELGKATYSATAVEVHGQERERVYRPLVESSPVARAYADAARRAFPVIRLDNLPAPSG